MFQQLSGRLGNQLFQWAFAHTLTERYNSQLTLFMDKTHANGFVGDDLFARLVPCPHIIKVLRNDKLGLLIKGLDKIALSSKLPGRLLENQPYLLRTFDSYQIPILPRLSPKLITGFFINSKNVEHMETTLLPELEKLVQSVDSNFPLPPKYQYVHIRRGDYVSNATTYGLLGAAYYKNFLDKNLPLIIGTDDKESSAGIIKDLQPSFVFSPENTTAWQALKMMANADSLILANSTLSWWGGFLAANQGKQVYSPSPFYKNDLKNDREMQYKKFIKVDSVFL